MKAELLFELETPGDGVLWLERLESGNYHLELTDYNLSCKLAFIDNNPEDCFVKLEKHLASLKKWRMFQVVLMTARNIVRNQE